MLDVPLPLKVVGSGPLARSSNHRRVEWPGQQGKAAVAALMRDAEFLIFPSEWFETFGLTIIEAYATGLPVIAGAVGAAAELVHDGTTGLLYETGNAAALVSVKWMLAHPAE